MSLANKPMRTDRPEMNRDWRAESDLRTLIEASKIKKDKARLKAALAERDEQPGHLSSIRTPRSY